MNPPCGTDAGYQRHRKRGQTPCEPCRLARNAYMREYRADPDLREGRRRYDRAYTAALRNLRDAHKAEFLLLLDAERSERS